MLDRDYIDMELEAELKRLREENKKLREDLTALECVANGGLDEQFKAAEERGALEMAEIFCNVTHRYPPAQIDWHMQLWREERNPAKPTKNNA